MIVTTICLDAETKQMMQKQAKKLHMNHSTLIRFLLIKNQTGGG